MKIDRFLLVLCLSLFLTACQEQREDTLETFNSSEKEQVWHGEREKLFGNYDYRELTEKEGLELLQEKFQLELPAFYNQMKELLPAYWEEQRLKELNTASQITVSETNVTYDLFYNFGKDEETELVVKVELVYELNVTQKTVRLVKQTLLIQNQSDDPALLLDQVGNFSKRMCETIHLEGIEEGLETFQAIYDETKGNLTEQVIIIKENTEELQERKGLLKSIQLSFDADSVLREYYANMTDLTAYETE